ncbi:MAG TPA: DUF3313 domain-containing protein [Victivallales bacterium]|nr:DUF3313 domain-containing protein [Victivallales bacterium]
MKYFSKIFVLTGFGLGLLVLSGCVSPGAEKIVGMPPKYEKLMKNSDGTFGLDKAWVDENGIRKYDKILIEVEIYKNQLPQNGWNKTSAYNLVSTHKEDLQYLKHYIKQSFQKSIEKSNYYQLTEVPGDNTLRLKLIIVQVILNKPILGAISNISMFTPIGLILSPLKYTGKSLSPNSGGAISIEGVISDSETGKIYSVFADREKGRVALFNSKDFSTFGNIRFIINKWSINIVTLLDQVKTGQEIHINKFEGYTFFA